MPSAFHPILLYDGICGLCHRLVQFILKRDHRDRFRFTALQSDFAEQVLHRQNATLGERNTICVVLDWEQPGERLVTHSDAVIVVLAELGGGWGMLAALLRLGPRLVRDWGYRFVARHRYQMFGKYEVCFLPEEKYREKFLD